MRSRGTPSASRVLQATSRASVESRPPETPMATGGLPMCSSRLARPATWVWKISSQRSRSCSWPARHERMGVDGRGASRRGGSPRPRTNGRRARTSRAPPTYSAGIAEAVGAQAVDAQAVEVDVGDQQRVVAPKALRLGQERAVLGDQAVAAEDDIGGRFLDAAGGVDVGGHAAAGLVDDELPAIAALPMTSLLADRLSSTVAPAQGLERAGRDRHPEVLADLDADDQALDVVGVEEAGRCRRGRGSPSRTTVAAARRGGGGEPAALVELLVIGDERFGHDAEHLAAVQHGGAVEELIVHRQRQADDGQAGEDGRARVRRCDQRVERRRAAASICWNRSAQV